MTLYSGGALGQQFVYVGEGERQAFVGGLRLIAPWGSGDRAVWRYWVTEHLGNDTVRIVCNAMHPSRTVARAIVSAFLNEPEDEDS